MNTKQTQTQPKTSLFIDVGKPFFETEEQMPSGVLKTFRLKAPAKDFLVIAVLSFLFLISFLIPNVSFAADIYLEPECATVGSNFNTTSDGAVSNGEYVAVQSGLNAMSSAPTSASDRITFTFDVSSSGSYKIFGRVNTPSADDDSFWVRANGGAWYMWNSIGASGWQWVQVHDSNNGAAPVLFSLNAGTNTIDIAYREDGALLDKIFLTTGSTVPSGMGSTASNCGGGGSSEVCGNGIDDDGDGLTDDADEECCSSTSTLSQTGWSLHYTDSEETAGEDGAASNSFDGNPSTIWHTGWSSSTPNVPHEIQIDLGTVKAVNGLRYLPRQDASDNGKIGNYEIYVSQDGASWGSAVASGTWTYADLSEKVVSFTAKAGRYVRLRALSEINGNAWTSAAEINVDVCGGGSTGGEICDNNIDDDGDGLVDCADPDCGMDCTDMSCADGVKVLTYTSASATGSGASGLPSISNFFIPEGNNRIVFLIASFEREHCQSGDNCTSYNTSAYGLGDNWATGVPVDDNYVITANFAGTAGNIDMQNHLLLPDGDLRFGAQWGFPQGTGQAGAFYSRESYYIAIYEDDLVNILGGSTSGNINITLPDVKLPLDAADDATLMAFVFANAKQDNQGIVRAGTNTTNHNIVSSSPSLNGNYTMTISDFDDGQEPDEATDGLLLYGMSGLGYPTTAGGFNTTNGFQELIEMTTTTNGGDFTTYNEGDGISVSAQFRNGPSSGIINSVSMQSSASYSIASNGGMIAAFKIESCDCNTVVIASGSTAICSGTSANISASASGGSGYTYAWSHGLGNGTSYTVSPTSTTTYTVTVTDDNNCTDTDQVTVTVNQTPTANAGADENLCRYFSTTLSASATGGSSPYTYSWSNAPGAGNDQTVTPMNTTTYAVTVTSNNGCNDTDQITVTVNNCVEICGNGLDDDGDGFTDCADSECGPTVNLGTDQNNCASTDITLTANGTGGDGTLTYSWSHGLGTGASKTVAPATTTTYAVTVTAPSGCTATDQVTVTVVPCSEDCYNGIDDDGDGLIDCDDPDCTAVAAPQLQPDVYETCPGIPYSNRVTYNDDNLQNPVFSIVAQPAFGSVTIDATGKFIYTPSGLECTTDNFIYQVCNQLSGCCATATVDITLGDNTFPVLTNVPADLTISCDDIVPDVPTVTAFDECPGLFITYEESSNQHFLGACESYTITRTWTAEDFCGNQVSDSQSINVMDLTKPEIFQVYTLENGKRLIAGVSQRVTDHWKYVPFPITFDGAPVILSQVSTNNDQAAVVARQRNETPQGFEIRVTEEEAADGSHNNESVAWLAIEAGALDGNMQYVAGTFANVTEVAKNLNFGQAFPAAPLLFTSLMTDNEMEAATVSVQSIDGTQASLKLEEETSADAEVAHADENIGFVALRDGDVFRNEKNEPFGEAGKMNVTNAWVTVNLGNTYTKPVVICSGLSKNDTDPTTIRVRNVTSNSFEVRLQEWDYLDGNHASEAVAWMVVEGSIPGNQSYYCSGNSVNQLQPNVNVFAMDNCDDIAAFGYQENESNAGNGLLTTRTWMAIDDCGNTSIISRYDTCVVAAVKVKTMLYGAAMNATGGLMRDNLRSLDLVPIEEPYSKLNSFSHVEYLHDTPVPTEAMIKICVDDDGTPTTLEVSKSELQAYLNSGALVGDCADNPNGKVAICHLAGTPEQHTIVVDQSALISHLDHGDECGPCQGTGNDLPPGAASGYYKTIANGNWDDLSIWEGGIKPPLTLTDKSVVITNHVTIQNSGLRLQDNGQLYVAYGSLTMLNGNFEINSGARAEFLNSMFDGSTAGSFHLKDAASQLKVTGGAMKFGQYFRNDGGKIKMEKVSIEISENMELNGGTDTLQNVCAIVHGNIVTGSAENLYAQQAKFHLPNGGITNNLFCSINGSDLIVYAENGGLLNLGSWGASISEYCISGGLTGIISSLLQPESCVNISTYFSPCECEEDLPTNNGNNTNNGPVILNEEVVNAGNSQGDGEMDPALLEVTGDAAIVDWVLLELRNEFDDKDILGYATVGLQRDGNIITEDGDDVIAFPGLGEGNYYVALRHRNHLGIMTDQPVYLSTNDVPFIDFTDPALEVRGGMSAGRIFNGERLMWAGDFNEDSKVIYQGPFNDVFFLFSRILAEPQNANYLANFIVHGYEMQDVNLDGKVIYQGPGNDRAPLLYHTILSHPGNASFLANFIVTGKLP